MAKLYFRYGAMGSSKTANVLMADFNYREKGMKTLIIKPSTDTRDGDGILASRIGLSAPCTMIDKDCNILNLLKEDLKNINVILADEVNFFTRDQINQLSDIVDYYNIPVLCYGLRADFQSNFFEGSKRLFEIADKIEEIKTICWCGSKATMNARISDGKMVLEGDQILIGANDDYISLCRKHWKEKKISL